MTTEKRKKGPPPGTRLGPRPQMWVTGTDPVRHQQHVVYRQQKNQAQWRGEVWELDFDNWIALWDDKWSLRGRKPEQYCMTRSDNTQPWNITNTIVLQRLDFLKLPRVKK